MGRSSSTVVAVPAGSTAMKARSVLVLLAILAAVARGSAAATDDGEVVELAPLEVSPFSLAFASDALPADLTVLDPGLIERANVGTVAELLESYAGIPLSSTTGQAASATVDLRGYGENSHLRTLILVDGLPLNRADMGAPSWTEVPLAHIERVEILRGPQSARFGDFAVGGVINIITRLDPAAGPASGLEVSGGSFGERSARARHYQPVGAGVATATASWQTSDGYRENGYLETWSGGLNYGYDRADGTRLRAGLYFVEDSTGFPGSIAGGPLGGFPEDPRRTPYAPDERLFNQSGRKLQGAAAFQTPIGSTNWQLHLRGAAAWRPLEWNLGYGSHADLDQVNLHFSPELRWSGESTRLGFGLAAQSHALNVKRFREITREHVLSTASLDRRALALFAEGSIVHSPRLESSLALRLERNTISGRNADDLRPRDPRFNFDRDRETTGFAAQAGIVLRPAPGQRAWIRYDRLYRFPVTDEIASYQGLPTTVPFNEELDPETGDNLELGGELQGEHWSARINGFAQRLEGEIAYSYERNQNLNFGDSRRMGIEGQVRLQTHPLELLLGGTLLDAQYTSGPYAGKRPVLVPRLTMNAVATWRPISSLRLSVEAIHHSRAYDGIDHLNEEAYHTIAIPAWTVVNLHVSWTVHASTTVFLRFNNLFDEAYATVKYAGGWYPEPGRHWRAGLRHEF